MCCDVKPFPLRNSEHELDVDIYTCRYREKTSSFMDKAINLASRAYIVHYKICAKTFISTQLNTFHGRVRIN